MCGIGGILRTDGQPIPEEWLDIIDARIAYRGPDGCGRFRDRVEIDDESAPNGKRVVEVAFVHRRLSIIDHAGGHQPMVSERGRNDSEGLVAVVFNGCIYNHRELRKELEGKGHTFVTDHSDTEVLIHGWREWGCDIVAHLEGMYAFALWDRAHTRLAMARDWSGEKPLYFVDDSRFDQRTDTLTVFASDPKAVDVICELSGLSRHAPTLSEVNPVDQLLLWGYCETGLGRSGQNTFEPVPRYCWARSATGPSAARQLQFDIPWYHLPFWIRPHEWRRDDESDPERLLARAVERRLEADVPLGCSLSGGIDSSLVAYFAKRTVARLRTFCVRMPDPRYDESHYAQNVANHIGTDHKTIDVNPNPANDLVRLIETLGQPFGDSSILPTYWVCRAAREHVKVVLSGDGGDELFLGYQRYQAAEPLKRWRHVLSLLPVVAFASSHPKSRLNKFGRLLMAARDFRHFQTRAIELIFRPPDVDDLLGPDVTRYREVWPATHDCAALDLRMRDLARYLPLDLLRKVDVASMACGLEVRAPFLDRDLAQVVRNLPIEQLMPNGQRKGLLRNIARKYLPREIVDRPKMGFAIPIGEWFRSDYGQMKTLLLDHLNSVEPFGPITLSRKAVQRFIDEHMSGKRDHGQRLFTLLTLSIWARQVKYEIHKR